MSQKGIELWLANLEGESRSYFYQVLKDLNKPQIFNLDAKETWLIRKKLGVFDGGEKISYVQVHESLLTSGYFDHEISVARVKVLVQYALAKLTLFMEVLQERKKLLSGNIKASVICLNASKKTRDALKNAQIKTIQELLQCPFEYLLGFTEPIWAEILQCSRALNLSFEDNRINDLRPGMNIRRSLKQKDYQNIPLSFLFRNPSLVQNLKQQKIVTLQDFISQDYLQLYTNHLLTEPFLDQVLYPSWKNIILTLFDQLGVYSEEEMVENLVHLNALDKIPVERVLTKHLTTVLNQNQIFTLEDLIHKSIPTYLSTRDQNYILNALSQYDLDLEKPIHTVTKR